MKINSEFLIAIVISIMFCFLVNKKRLLEGIGETIKQCSSGGETYNTEYMPLNMRYINTPRNPTCEDIAKSGGDYAMMIYPPHQDIVPLRIVGGFGMGVGPDVERDVCECYGCDFDESFWGNTCKEKAQ